MRARLPNPRQCARAPRGAARRRASAAAPFLPSHLVRRARVRRVLCGARQRNFRARAGAAARVRAPRPHVEARAGAGAMVRARRAVAALCPSDPRSAMQGVKLAPVVARAPGRGGTQQPDAQPAKMPSAAAVLLLRSARAHAAIRHASCRPAQLARATAFEGARLRPSAPRLARSKPRDGA